MKYKQYIWVDECGHDGKIICSLKAINAGEISDFIERCWITRDEEKRNYIRDDFGQMRISFIDERIGETEDCWEFESTEFLEPNEPLYTRNYVQALFGRIPRWMPTLVNYACDYIHFRVDEFSNDGEWTDYNIVFLNCFPVGCRIKLEVESHEEVDPDTYIITNVGTDSRNYSLAVEEYRNGKLLRTCELGRDKKGDYELITEA